MNRQPIPVILPDAAGPGTRDEPMDVHGPPHPAKTGPSPTGGRRPRFAAVGIWLACALVLVLSDLTGTLLVVHPGNGAATALDRASIAGQHPTSYESALLSWPLVAAASFVLSAVLLHVGARAGAGLQSRSDALAYCLAAVGGFLSILVGLRWVGFAAARAFDGQPLHIGLGLAPIAFIVAGAAGSVPPFFSARRLRAQTGLVASERMIRVRLAGLAGTAALLLLALPLAPLARTKAVPGALYDELTMAAIQRLPSNPLHGVAESAAVLRAELWILGSLAAVLWALAGGVPALAGPSVRAGMARASLLLALPLAAFFGATYKFVVAVDGSAGARLADSSAVLFVGCIALGLIWVDLAIRIVRSVWEGRRATRPHRASRHASPAADGPRPSHPPSPESDARDGPASAR